MRLVRCSESGSGQAGRFNFWAGLRGALALGAFAPSLAGCGASFTPLSSPAPLTSIDAGIHRRTSSSWTFSTLNNPDEREYSTLSGITNLGKISGYTGDGSSKHPHRGFIVTDYGNASFRGVNFPGGHDTLATSLNNTKAVAGYFTSKQGWIFGFILQGGLYTSYKDTKLNKGHTNITKLLGINDADLAVGYYTADNAIDHAFELNAATGQFHAVTPPGGISVQATGINGKGDIVGFMTTQKGATACSDGCKSWLLKGGSYTVLSYPHSSNTQALAVNWQDQIAGLFVDGSGKTHGFVLSDPFSKPRWTQIDEPKAHGYTAITSIQDKDYMVGYYRPGGRGFTNGFLATPHK